MLFQPSQQYNVLSISLLPTDTDASSFGVAHIV